MSLSWVKTIDSDDYYHGGNASIQRVSNEEI